MENLFCRHHDLRNEADVEQAFARRLIEALGYPDRDIRPKAALEELSVGKELGSSRLHRPDFAMKSRGHFRWIMEVKSPKESLEHHFEQANGYCEAINNSYATTDPVKQFVLTNGIQTRIYDTGNKQPVLTLQFSDFEEDNQNFQELKRMLKPDAFSRGRPVARSAKTISFTKPSIAEVNYVFSKCHQHIHQSDHISQAAAFVEFVKLITLKLLSDREIQRGVFGSLGRKILRTPCL